MAGRIDTSPRTTTELKMLMNVVYGIVMLIVTLVIILGMASYLNAIAEFTCDSAPTSRKARVMNKRLVRKQLKLYNRTEKVTNV